MITAGWLVLALGALGFLTVFAVYPALVRLRGAQKEPAREPATTPAAAGTDGALPPVTVIVAARNAAALVREKLANFQALDYPRERLALVLCSDGSTDDTLAVARAAAGPGVTVLDLGHHGGKHIALNHAVEAARGDVLVFTDVDAMLEPGAVRHLVAPFARPDIGGVCGRRMIGELGSFAAGAQASYVALDSGLKAIESRRGSVTSNDGKLYAIRRALFRPVPGGVTDDLFACLAVVDQGARFVYEGRARAWIKNPSRSGRHEVSRRRRIVCRSLRGIQLMRGVLDPRRTGLFAFGLATNKVGRRLLPVFLILALAGTALLATGSRVALGALGLQLVFYSAALLRPLAAGWPLPGPLAKAWDLAHYFVLGSYGTLLGLSDFLRGREVTKWNPIKQD